MSEMTAIYTIGHSNHETARFLELLKQHGIEMVIDVRSEPYSRWASQFNKAEIQFALVESGITYRYSGDKIGGKPKDESLLERGVPDYDRLAATAEFQSELEEVIKIASEQRVALMCSEADPYECHRERLLARELRGRGVEVVHILADGSVSRPEQGSLL